MSKKTLGLFDDPLGLGNNDDNNNDKKKGLTSLFDNNNNQDDIGLFKTLDSSKINLKKDKNNQGKIIAIQPPSKPQNAAEKGLGFSTSLWDNDDNITNTKKLDDLFNDTTTSLLSNDSTTSLFSNKNDIKKNDDALADIGININPNIQINTSSGKVNTGNLDDNKLDDLKVGKLIEKEDDLDFELFGKKNIVQARSLGTILHKQKNISENEDLEVESAEVLDNLEKVTLKDNVFTTIATKKESQSPVITPTVNTDDIDISKFDINAYINENSGPSGGLFD